ncbi:MAG: hypothetical protein ACTHQQ_19225 [Solirubrobacteraceae bacterium]
MTTPLLIAGSEPSAITICRYHLRDRVLARLHASRIDRALAAGVSPDSSAATSVRAHELIGMRTRQTLSGDLRDLISQARAPALRVNAVPICRRKIIAAQELIEATASRLVEDRPVSARGVAQIRLLLTDGLSPVYGDPNGRDLLPLVRAAMAALEPRI